MNTKKTKNPIAKSRELLSEDKEGSLFKLRFMFLRGSVDVHDESVPPRTMTYYSRDTPEERRVFHEGKDLFKQAAEGYKLGKTQLLECFKQFGGFVAQCALIERLYRQVNLKWGKVYLNQVHDQMPTGDWLPLEFYHRVHDYVYVGGKWQLPKEKEPLQTYFINGQQMTPAEKQQWVREEYSKILRTEQMKARHEG